MSNKRIFLSPPHMSGRELEWIKTSFEENWIAPAGPQLGKFEQKLSNYLSGNVHTLALNSGTSAMHMALKAIGIQKGDIVLCQSFTFAGTVNPVLYEGAEPVFIDSEKDTWNMDPNLLKEAIGFYLNKGIKPSAIIYVHLYGMPAKVDQILSIAREYDIPVIEDAAEALGSIYKDKSAGILGDLSIISFNGNKIVTTSGGGALVSNNKNWIEIASSYSNQSKEDTWYYEHRNVGYNYRLSNISASIGLGQLDVIDQRVDQKRKIFQWYQENLTQLDGIKFQPEASESRSNRWLTTILIDDPGERQSWINSFEQSNIECRPLCKPMHLQPVFKGCRSFLDGTSEEFFQRGLCLPSGTAMDDEDLKRILNAISYVYSKDKF